MTTRIEIFNEMVGLIFAQLYQRFPVPSTIRPDEIGRAMSLEVTESETLGEGFFDIGNFPSGDGFYPMLYSAALWLRDEGFIRATGESAVNMAVLTSRALAILNATPLAVGGETLGRQLTDVATEAGTEAGRATISAIVGEIIGAFARSYSHG